MEILPPVDGRLHRRVTISLQIALLVGLVFEIWQAQWLNAAATVGVLVLTLLPMVLESTPWARWLSRCWDTVI